MDTIQIIFKALDPGLAGKPVPERSYAEDCSLTIPAFTNACDRFLIGHFLGWFLKCMMLRDPMLCHFLSFLFEILEYLFTYLQPNFAECWWDHVSGVDAFF
jgi:phosphatidylserine synthase 2